MRRTAKMLWDGKAERELSRVPFFVRPLVRRKVEERTRKHGRARVSLADFREAEARYKAVVAGKSDDEVMKMFPRPNLPDVEMLIVEVCHNELSECPNPLIETGAYKDAIERWAADREISERLRSRVGEETVKFHHKFRVSISGCPNGCSRPQIADLGIVGLVRPEFDPGECESCGACAEVCPDQAIRYDGGPPWFSYDECQGCKLCQRACAKDCIELSSPSVKILAGGKLGRHPRLAESIGEAATPDEAVAIIDQIVSDFIVNSEGGERFADYWSRRGKEVRNG